MVTIGTWNLENLFRPGTESGPSGEKEYTAKLDTLAATIGEIDPDVLAVQEVGSPEALSDLVEQLDGAWHTEIAEPDDRGIRVATLSRMPADGVAHVVDFPPRIGPVTVDDAGATIDRLGRAGLHLTVTLGGRGIDLVTAHLKSKLLSYPGGRFSPRDEDERARYATYALHRRAAEAAGVRTYVTGLLGDDPDRAVIVAGDLNDDAEAATTQILLGPPGSEIGSGGFDRPDQGDAQRLWNLAPLIPEDERYTRIYRGRRELVDHILVSHSLLDALQEAGTGPGQPPSIADTPTARRDEPGSDHRPVVVRLDVSR